MAGDLVPRSEGGINQWDDQQVRVLRELIAPDLSDPEFILFGQVCHRTQLDPFRKQIYAITRNVWDAKAKQKRPKMTIQVAIDGLRLIADRSGLYAGSETFWCGPDGVWADVWLKPAPPAAAKTVVWKKGVDRPFVGVARFEAYCQHYEGKAQGQWATMPDVMIAKCAEALALRKAFPADMSGLYTTEEMQQADNAPIQAVDITPRSTPAPAPAKPVPQRSAQVSGYISDGQRRRMWVIANKHGWEKDDVKVLVAGLCGSEAFNADGEVSTSCIPAARYDEVIAALEKGNVVSEFASPTEGLMASHSPAEFGGVSIE